MRPTIIHFHRVDDPKLTYVAIEDGDHYTCEVPVKTKGKIHTAENTISKNEMASYVQTGRWIMVKVNGIKVSELNNGC